MGRGHLVTLLGASGDRFGDGLGDKRRRQPVCGENVLRKSRQRISENQSSSAQRRAGDVSHDLLPLTFMLGNAALEKVARISFSTISGGHDSSTVTCDQYVRVPSITSLSATYSLHSVPQIRRTCSRSSLALSRLPCSACHMP